MHQIRPKRANAPTMPISEARRRAIDALIAGGYQFEGEQRPVHNAQEAEILAAAQFIRLPD